MADKVMKWIESLRKRWSGRQNIFRLVVVAAFTLAISMAHYTTEMGEEDHILHHIHFILYFFPLLMASIWFGFRGGLVASAAILLIYLPPMFRHIEHEPALATQRLLEVVLVLAIGLLTGLLADRQARTHIRYRKTADELGKAYEKLRRQTTELLDREEQLQRASRLAALGEISAAIAHEVRNPLGAILGAAEILKDDYLPGDPKYDFLQILIEEARRLDRTTSMYLNFSAQRRMVWERIDLIHAIDRLADFLQFQCSGKGIEIQREYEKRITQIEGDRNQLEQLLLNLAVNSIAAMPDGGTLAFSVESEDREGQQWVKIEISDTGQGICEEDKKKLFEPFFTTREGGTGLGLAIARRITKAHNGEIRVESEIGKGTRVCVFLPLQRQKEVPGSKNGSSVAPYNAKPLATTE